MKKTLLVALLLATTGMTGCVQLHEAVMTQGLDYVKVEKNNALGYEFISKEEFEKREKERKKKEMERKERQRQEALRQQKEQAEREKKQQESVNKCFDTYGTERIKFISLEDMAQMFVNPSILAKGTVYQTTHNFVVSQSIPGGVLAYIGRPQFQVFIKTNKQFVDHSLLPNMWVLNEGKTYQYKTVLGATRTIYRFDEINDREYQLMKCLMDCNAISEY